MTTTVHMTTHEAEPSHHVPPTARNPRFDAGSWQHDHPVLPALCNPEPSEAGRPSPPACSGEISVR